MVSSASFTGAASSIPCGKPGGCLAGAWPLGQSWSPWLSCSHLTCTLFLVYNLSANNIRGISRRGEAVGCVCWTVLEPATPTLLRTHSSNTASNQPKKKKSKSKKPKQKPNKTLFLELFETLKKKSHCNGGGSRRSYQHNQKGKEKLLSFTRHCHQQQAQHEEVFSAPGCSYSTGEEQRDINDAVARTSQLD